MIIPDYFNKNIAMILHFVRTKEGVPGETNKSSD